MEGRSYGFLRIAKCEIRMTSRLKTTCVKKDVGHPLRQKRGHLANQLAAYKDVDKCISINANDTLIQHLMSLLC